MRIAVARFSRLGLMLGGLLALVMLFAAPASACRSGACYVDSDGNTICPEDPPYITGYYAATSFIIDAVDASGNIIRWSEINYAGWKDQCMGQHANYLTVYCSDAAHGCIAQDMVNAGWRPPNWEGGW